MKDSVSEKLVVKCTLSTVAFPPALRFGSVNPLVVVRLLSSDLRLGGPSAILLGPRAWLLLA